MKRTFHTPVFILLLLALLCCHISVASAASPRDISISVQWTDGWGNAQLSDPALPVTDSPEEHRFWLTVPYDAPLNALTLQISDLSGELTAFLPAQDETLADVREAVDLQGPYTEITAFNAFGEQAKVFWLYISTQPMPQEEVPVQGAAVTVRYLDDSWNPIAPDSVQMLAPGENTVYPDVYLSPEEYELTSADSYHVFVDASGANPSEVWFVYHRLPKMAQITVRYLDENSQPLLADGMQTLEAGIHTVYAQEIPGYAVVGDSAREVTVDMNGASPAEIVFVYARELLPSLVTVHYIDERGETIAPDDIQQVPPGESQVYPMADINPDDYLLTGASYYDITVTTDGASPDEITFVYQRLGRTVTVAVHYVDERGETIAPDTYQTYGEGEHTVTPTAEIAAKDYILELPASYALTVTLEGATLNEVTFTYRRVVKPAVITVHYVDTENNPLAADTQETFTEGNWVVFPNPTDLPAHYELDAASPALQTVNVTVDGASPAEITFIYTHEVLPDLVTVHYIDEQGEAIAPDDIQQVPPGKSQIFPVTVISTDDYLLTGAFYYDILVTADGANYKEVTFTYHRIWNYEYTVLEDGTAEITDCKGDGKTLVIPEALDGIQITGIGNKAFSYLGMSSVTIPDSITHIGINPFIGCEKLQSIVVSKEHPTLSVIDGVLLSKPDNRLVTYPIVKKDVKYTVPNGVQVIGNLSIWGNDFLREIEFPDTVLSIEKNAFLCENLKNISLPSSLFSIAESAFSSCDSLISISIPASVEKIGEGAFLSCTNLSRINVSPESPVFAAIDGVLFSKTERKLLCYPIGKNESDYSVPNGIKSIGKNAFRGCKNLSSIVLPETVTEIGDEAFFGCENLFSVNLPNALTEIHDSTFWGCNMLNEISIPNAVTQIGACAFVGCASLTEVLIPPSVKSIRDHAFIWCDQLKSVTIPASVESIGSQAFIGHPDLTLHVERNSYAAQYCQENKLNYIYPDSLDWLNDW